MFGLAGLRRCPPSRPASQCQAEPECQWHPPAAAGPGLAELAARAAPDELTLLPGCNVLLVRCAAYSRCKASNAAVERALGVQATTRSRGTVAALAALCAGKPGGASRGGHAKRKRASG